MPSSPRINSDAMVHTARLVIDDSTTEMVSVRAFVRGSTPPASSARPAALRRRSLSRSDSACSTRWLAKERMARWMSRLMTNAPTTMKTTRRGMSMNQLANDASVSLSVVSNTHLQKPSGSSPQASTSRLTESKTSGDGVGLGDSWKRDAADAARWRTITAAG